MLEKLVLKVGKREIDDREKIPVKGALVKPERKVDLGIFFVTGFLGRWQDYMKYFSLELGKIWPIYTTEIRQGGLTFGGKVVKDIYQIDEQIRDILETDRIIYFGHSMDLPLGIEAAKRHQRQVLGYFGMATYPSLGDWFNSNPDIQKRNLVQSLLDCVASATNFAPMAYSAKEANVVVPIHFVIGENDEITRTLNFGVRKRFENYFSKFLKGSFVVIPGNHCFNQKYLKLAPYNQDNPKALITITTSFLEQFA